MPNLKSLLVERDKMLLEDKEILQYSKEEKEQVGKIYQVMQDSWSWMNTPQKDFDDQSLIQLVHDCRLRRNSYLEPIHNDGEVRVVTGTLEGKVDSVFNAVFNQNVEAEIRAFNEFDIEDFKLGDKLTKVTWRSGQIEREDDLWEQALDDLLAYPAVFIQEANEEEWFAQQEITEGTWEDLWNFKEVKFTTKKHIKRRKPVKVIWPVDQVMLADPRIPARLIHKQPAIITYRRTSYEEMEAKYGKSPRWKYVRPGNLNQSSVNTDDINGSNWRFGKLGQGECEEIVYRSLHDNEIQIIVNGVPMAPVGTPFRRKFFCYDMGMFVLKPIKSNLAYGRSLVMMGKVLQALKDESFRLKILQFRQSIFHPIVTKTAKNLSKDMWLPATITYGVAPTEIGDLMDKQQANVSDFGMNEMIEREIEAFLNVSAIFQGVAESGNQTASEIAARMKQAMIMLGHALSSYMRMKRDMTYLRLYNILEEFLAPTAKRYNDFTKRNEDVYQTYSISETDIYGGMVGNEIIQFVDRQLLPEEEEESLRLDELAKKAGRPQERTFIDIKKLLAIPYLFYVSVVPKEKRSSLLEREMWKKDFGDALKIGQFLGRQPSPDVALREYAKHTDIEMEELFPEVADQLANMDPRMMAALQGQRAGQGGMPQGAAIESPNMGTPTMAAMTR